LTNHNSIKQQVGANGTGPKSQRGWQIVPLILHHKAFCKEQKTCLSGIKEETVARVKAVTECVTIYFSESVGEGGELYYHFEEAFHERVSPGIFTLLETDGCVKVCDIGIEIGTTKNIDELCMDDFICDDVFYCFSMDRKSSFWHMDGRNIKIRSLPI
jgi:hypothetical protein